MSKNIFLEDKKLRNQFINGEWIEGASKEISSFDSSTLENIFKANSASASQVQDALLAAEKARPSWQKLSLGERINYLEKFVNVLESKRDDFAKLISTEMGKPFWEAKTEVSAMLAKIPASISAHNERCLEKEISLPDSQSVTRFKPHGLLAVFGPFNFPGHLPNGHIVPSLLAGNTIVFKPSEKTPLTGAAIVKLWEEAGLPAGVLNLVQGEKEVGVELASSLKLDGLCFTGSSDVGQIIHKNFAGSPEKILALEMGGNNPLVVWSYDDIKAAAYAGILSSFITSGQRCTCARRIILKDDIADSFLEEFLSQASKLKLGFYDSSPEPFCGPVIDQASANSLLKSFDDLIKLGAKPLKDLKLVIENKALLSPGVLDVTNVKNLPDKEYFGPLLQVKRVKSLDEAIDFSNNTRFGLSAGIFAKDLKDYQTFYQGIRAGIVNWNRQTTGASSKAPFGGVGLSGNHRPSAWFAADYASYPVASIESDNLTLPEQVLPGVEI